MTREDRELAERARAFLQPGEGTGPVAVWAIWLSDLDSHHRSLVEHGRSRIDEVLAEFARDGRPQGENERKAIVSRVIARRSSRNARRG